MRDAIMATPRLGERYVGWHSAFNKAGRHPESDIQGPPIVSAGALWFETDQGLYVFTDGSGGFRLASSFAGYISGGCA
jgi:hypothetical protein